MATDKPSVEAILDKQPFSTELHRLRAIVQTTDLEESVKWGMPCYAYKGKNILGIGGFKQHFCIWFFQGALLSDPAGVLVNAQEGKTKALRQWRMETAQDIKPTVLKKYIKEAIVLEEAGKRIVPDKPARKAPAPPAELDAAFRNSARLRASFAKLSPAKQAEYSHYIEEAKRKETRLSRIEKITPMILEGKGLNDKYLRK